MAKKKGTRWETQLDWYYISSQSLVRVIAGLGLLTVLVVGAMIWYAQRSDGLSKRAQDEVAQAEVLVADARRIPEAQRLLDEIRELDRRVNDARAALSTKEYEKATRLAVDAQSLARRILSGKVSGQRPNATVVDTAGRVELQKTGLSSWQPLKVNDELGDGDFIKTGPNGSAEIMASDGTLYRIKPETLFEVHRGTTRAGAGTTGRSSEIKFIVGNVDINTGEGGRSVVKTDGAVTDIDRNSVVGMDSDTKRTGVSTFKGQATMRDPSGRSLTLAGGERATATKDGGGLSEKVKLPDPPTALAPDDNASFDFRKKEPIFLKWTPGKNVNRYHLQIARNRLFVPDSLVINDDSRQRENATLSEVRETGSYWWRVRLLGRNGADSDWSGTRKFKVVTEEPAKGGVPPDLVLQRPLVNGNTVIVSGKTEPGATVTVNGELADPDINGVFRKIIQIHNEGFNTVTVRAVNGMGAETVRRENVLIQSY
jgi:FecR protein